MNKNQKNRKLIQQNTRNKMINRRYTSTIKTIFKIFSLKVGQFSIAVIEENQIEIKNEIFKLVSSFYSIVDKAIKKGVLHKNTGARKKSKISQIFAKI